MPHVSGKHDARIYFKDWGSGQPIVFSHGWPLNADAWDNQMLYFGQRGYRVIAHDRRSHGRSDQTWDHNDMDTYADDLAAVIDHLDLNDAILIGHSTGGGEVARYIGRHGTSRVAKAVLVDAITPQLVKTPSNPEGAPKEIIDSIRQGVAGDRSQFWIDLSLPFYGFNRDGAHISEGLRQSFWQQGMMAGIKGLYDCSYTWEADYTPDLKKFDRPTLIIHGDDDQIAPIAATGLKAHKIVKGSELKVYPGAPHGLAQTMPDRFNADVLDFIQGAMRASAAGA